jgi:MFS family permease
MAKSSLQHDIRKFILFNILMSFVLYYAIDKAFMQLRGLTVSQIVLVEIIYSVLLILLEVPLGALSDRWSRKYVLALNAFFFMLNTYWWVIAKDVNLFLLGALAAAVHSALLSGTDTSYLYDLLKEKRQQHLYERYWGRTLYYTGLFAIAGTVLGAWVVARLGLEMPFWITLIFSGAGLLVALTLREPRFHRSSEDLNYWQHIRSTAKHIIRQPALLTLILFWVMLESTFIMADEYGQLYFLGLGLPIVYFGYLGTVPNILESLGGRFAETIGSWPRQQVYTVLLLLSTIGFLLSGIAHNSLGLIFAFLPQVAFYFAAPLLVSDLHRNLPSSKRATGESFASLLITLAVLPVGFTFAFLSDHYSIFTGYLALGLLLLAYFVFVYLPWLRKMPVKGKPTIKKPRTRGA